MQHGVIRNPENYSVLGFNFKISDLLASLAVPQFKNYQVKVENLIQIHNYYQQNLSCKELKILNIDKNLGSVPVYVEGYSENRDALILYLDSLNIQTSKFHNPIHSASYLNTATNKKFDNSTNFSKNAFILPSGPSQYSRDIDRVLEALNKF